MVTYVYYRRIDSVTEGDEIYGILSGVSSSAFSLGWATVFINDYIILFVVSLLVLLLVVDWQR